MRSINPVIARIVLAIVVLGGFSSLSAGSDSLRDVPYFRPGKPAKMQSPRARLKGHRSSVSQVAFSPDGKYLASLADALLLVWEVGTAKLVASIESPVAKVSTFAFTPDGQALVIGGAIGNPRKPQIGIFDIKAGKIVRHFTPPKGLGKPMCVTPDGKTLILGGRGGSARLVELATGKDLGSLPGDRRVLVMAVSADGKRLVTANLDDSLLLWDLKKREVIHDLSELKFNRGLPLTFSPDGKELAVGSTFLDITDKPKMKYKLALHEMVLSAEGVAYSPDSKVVAVVGFRPGLVLWDCTRKQLLNDFFGETPKPNSAVAFSPDGRTVATGGHTYKGADILLWDVPQPKAQGKK